MKGTVREFFPCFFAFVDDGRYGSVRLCQFRFCVFSVCSLLFYCPDFLQIRAAQNVQMFKDLFGGPVPPLQLQQVFGQIVIETLSDNLAGISPGNAVGGDVFRHHRICGNDGAVTDMDAGHHRNILSDPYIVAHYGVALKRKVIQRGHGFFPAAAHDVEWIGGNAAHPVVGAIHDKLDALGDGTEFSDDELVAQKLIMMGDVLLKALRAVDVVVVGIVAHKNIGTGDDILNKADTFDRFVGVDRIRIRAVLHRIPSFQIGNYNEIFQYTPLGSLMR